MRVYLAGGRAVVKWKKRAFLLDDPVPGRQLFVPVTDGTDGNTTTFQL